MTVFARRTILVGAVAIGLAGAALYGTLPRPGNSGEAACQASVGTLARLAPLARGEMAAFTVASAPAAAPALAFDGPDGARRTLADFRGRTVLLNLWATWCEPCKREMPALDRLQADLGGPNLEVVAINVDTRNLERPREWLATNGIARLAYYSDREARVFQELRRSGDTEGLPFTLLVDRDGCRLGRLAGWAEWASPEGFALLKAAVTSP